MTHVIHHLVQEYGPIQQNIAHHMDNMGMIKRLEELNNKIQGLPRDCFKAEWDVLSEVKHTMSTMGVKLITQHEKGHQDEKTKYEDLPLLGQLNVDADKLATQALLEANIEELSPLFSHRMSFEIKWENHIIKI